MTDTAFGILGGDYRYKILFELLKNDGFNVDIFGSACMSDTVRDAIQLIEGADIIIAPIPFSKDGRNIFLRDEMYIDVYAFTCDMAENGVKALIAGVISDTVRSEAAEKNICAYDFFDMEEVAVLNAIPTAEGAVQTAMQESERTLFGSDVLVMGFGRCGKVLANMLKGIGARVSVACRRESDRAYIYSLGLTPVSFDDKLSLGKKYSFVFNTVPAPVIDRKMLDFWDSSTVIIDLAQAPGGTDFSYARELGIKALYCPGLPGRVAPYTAACILKDAVLSIAKQTVG